MNGLWEPRQAGARAARLLLVDVLLLASLALSAPTGSGGARARVASDDAAPRTAPDRGTSPRPAGVRPPSLPTRQSVQSQIEHVDPRRWLERYGSVERRSLRGE